MSKYNNRYTHVDGIRFDSIKEADRYSQLKLEEKGGFIKYLKLQPSFVLQEGFHDSMGVRQRAIKYVADFQYYDIQEGKEVVEDVKGMLTDVYKIKKKLFLKRYPQYYFQEV